MNWIERHLGGHVNLFGRRVTIYGANAMHWGVNISTRWGFVCFRLPFRCFGRWWPLYLYVSRNATPWGAWWALDSRTKASMSNHADLHLEGSVSDPDGCHCGVTEAAQSKR